MARVRISTTVDQNLLETALDLQAWHNQSELMEAALKALLSNRRNAEVDNQYRAYDDHPLSEPDEWGDLQSFCEAAGAS